MGRIMGRLGFAVLLLLLLIVCMGAFINAHAVATHSGLDPDLTETLGFEPVYSVLVACVVSSAILVRYIQQVLLSRQIVTSFFHFSWHNSIFGKLHQLFFNWPKAENVLQVSRPFYLYM